MQDGARLSTSCLDSCPVGSTREATVKISRLIGLRGEGVPARSLVAPQGSFYTRNMLQDMNQAGIGKCKGTGKLHGWAATE